MGFSNFLTAYGQPPRQTPQLQNWLVSLLGFLEGVPGIQYQASAGDPTVPTSLDALYPGGADNGIVVWENTTLSTVTLYFNFSGSWVVGPATSAGSAVDEIPAGTVVPYAGTAVNAATLAPGWLICYGQAVSRATYVDLFAALGTTHGSGDGSTTFNLPDLRGRVIVGNDNMGGSSANVITDTNADSVGGEYGEETHALTEAELAAHNHALNGTSNSPNTTSPAGAVFGTTGASTVYRTITGATDRVFDDKSISDAGSGTGHNNVQPSTFLHYLIKT